jgi:hypothetical protein
MCYLGLWGFTSNLHPCLSIYSAMAFSNSIIYILSAIIHIVSNGKNSSSYVC